MERYNLKNLNDVEVKEEYQVKISYRFATLEYLDDDDDDDDDDVSNDRAGESINHNIKVSATHSQGYYELKQQA